jgi:hypothetical protein
MNNIKYTLATAAFSLLTLAIPLSSVHATTAYPTSAMTTPATTKAGLTTAQKNAILGLLKSFGADAAVIAKVTAALNK